MDSYIEKNLSYLLDVFTSFYGMGEFSALKSQLEKTTVFFYRDRDWLQEENRKLKIDINLLAKNMVNDFCTQHHLNDINKRCVLFNRVSVLSEDIFNSKIQVFYDFFYEHDDRKLSGTLKLLVRYGLLSVDDLKNSTRERLKEDIIDDFNKGRFEELNCLVYPYLEMRHVYEQEIQLLRKEISNNERLIEEINQIYMQFTQKKYFPMLVEKFKDYIPIEEYNIYTNDIKNGVYKPFSSYPYISKLLGNGLEEYISNVNLDQFKNINQIKRNLFMELKREAVNYLPDVACFHQKLKRENSFFPFELFDSEGFRFAGSMESNYKFINDKLELFPIVFFNCSNLKNAQEIGSVHIHEFNHMKEAAIFYVSKTCIIDISGWHLSCFPFVQNERLNMEKLDLCYQSLSDNDKNILEKLGYCLKDFSSTSQLFSFVESLRVVPKELLYLFHANLPVLNEVVNQLITKDICNCCNISYEVSSYDFGFAVVREFYESFKTEIIESRKNANIQKIFQTVGQDNFFALADLTYDFVNENYDDKLMQHSFEKYTAFMDKKDEILKKMLKYKEEHCHKHLG